MASPCYRIFRVAVYADDPNTIVSYEHVGVMLPVDASVSMSEPAIHLCTSSEYTSSDSSAGEDDASRAHSNGPSTSDARAITTMVISNLPCRISQRLLVSALDASGFGRKYDFVYMPSNIQSGQGKGYAFVNFKTVADAQVFRNVWNDSMRFGPQQKKDCMWSPPKCRAMMRTSRSGQKTRGHFVFGTTGSRRSFCVKAMHEPAIPAKVSQLRTMGGAYGCQCQSFETTEHSCDVVSKHCAYTLIPDASFRCNLIAYQHGNLYRLCLSIGVCSSIVPWSAHCIHRPRLCLKVYVIKSYTFTISAMYSLMTYADVRAGDMHDKRTFSTLSVVVFILLSGLGF